ncbi:MAG TPA: amidohydrolase family protein, partial [Lacipirellula sp.]
DRPPIEGGYVTVVDGRIAEVGPKPPDAGRVEDLGDAILLPGLVNAHTHLEFSDLERPLGKPGMSLPEWIRLVIGDRKRGDRDAAAAIAAGLKESLNGGVTTIGEIATSPATHYAGAEQRPAMLQFQEAIGFSGGRVESVFGDVRQRLEAATAPKGLSPHAPYSVHPALLERIVSLARGGGVPVAMHLAESREELQLLDSGDGPFRELLQERSMWDAKAIPTGSRPLDYLRILLDAPRALVIHGNYLAADEIEFIAQRRQQMSVVFCPRTHEYFGHSPYPLNVLLAAGARVALGTDSRASNPDLNLLAELRHAAMRMPNVGPEQWLRIATLNGAEALGLANDAGSLTPGKRANIIALPCNAGSNAPYASLLDEAVRPHRMWLDGRVVSSVSR